MYSGKLQLCRAAVNGTVIDLPEGITRQKVKEGDAYQVPFPSRSRESHAYTCRPWAFH